MIFCYNFYKKVEVKSLSIVPLDISSTYDLLNSTIRPEQLVQVAKKKGYSAIALTDPNVLYAAVDFYNAAQKVGIIPIIGLKLDVKLGNLADQKIQVTVIAKNTQGYQSLMQLSTARMTSGSDLNLQEFLRLCNQCFVIIHPTTDVLDAQGNQDVATFLKTLKQLPSSVFLGTNLSLDVTMQSVLRDLSVRFALSLIADEKVEYLNANDYFATQVLRSIRDGRQIDQPLSLAQNKGQYFLHTADELTQQYEALGLDEAIKNNQALVANSRFEIHFQKPVLPKFPVPQGETTAKYLEQLCVQGLKKRTLAPNTTIQDYQKRLRHELTVIHNMGFDDYFLIVWDIMNFIHRSNIMSGPGRGSAAGSLVAYALQITDVDPLQYGLLFERFLNPERAQMPDIDLDIPDNQRQRVLEYVHQRYGHQRVAQIITFGTLAARQVIRDVGRVFSIPKYQVEEVVDILRSLGGHHSITLQSALDNSQSLRNLMADNPLTKLMIQTAQQLEGLPRHYSTHAAGVVLSSAPLKQIVPLQAGNDEVGMMMTQYPKEIVESVGLLKMDFLGLRNLSIMDAALQLIRQVQPDFDITKISLNDVQTLQLFRSGRTDGIFQFESSGIRNTLIRLQPDSFEDIVAVNALYRPGPLDNIPHFIARKHGQEPVEIPDASLQPILGPTYGILVYQEQVMQVASLMAGFTLGQADLLRRAMSKKKRATMESMRQRFLKGATARGYSLKVATQVFNYIDQFANYGFNRSHAVAYSKMAFEMAYLKVHFPEEFFTALLNIEPNETKQRHHLLDAKQFNVEIIPPRINQSSEEFKISHHKVIMGLSMVKGIRRDFIRAIVEERKKRPFASLPDFVQRMGERWQKKELIEPLIYVGAFDGLGYNRAEMINGLTGLFSGNEFSFLSDDLQPVMQRRQEYPLTYRLIKEKEYLGIYLSGHPVNQYNRLRQQLNTVKISDLNGYQHARLIVMINRLRQINTKKTHQPMAFADVSDETGDLNVTIFPRQYQKDVDKLQPNSIVMITGKTEQRQGQVQLIAESIVPVDQLQSDVSVKNSRWVLRVIDGQSVHKITQALQEVIKQHPGNVPVVFFNEQKKQAKLLPKAQWLDDQENTHNQLNKIFGSDNVVLQHLTN